MSGLDDLTIDARMRAATVWIARTCVEVERGLRDERQLATLLPASVRHTVRDRFRLASTPGGPVTADDIGRVTLSRPVASHLYASISTRVADGRWSALSIHYLTVKGRIHVADVHRPERTRHHPDPGRVATLVPGDTPWHELDRTTELRDLVTAAAATSRDRLATMSPDDPLHPSVEQLATSLAALGQRLDQQVLEAARATEVRAAIVQHRGRL